MRHAFAVKVGPVGFRVGSAWRGPIVALAALYAGYPAPDGAVPDFTVRLEPERPWRRLLRPSVAVRGDYVIPDAAPLPLAQGLLAAEMGMNLQMALGARRWLLLHASGVERDGRALLMSGHSGAGKSTLSALLAERGWRLLGDEFALVDLASGAVHPFPRPISLKNEAIAVMAAEVAADRLGPLLAGTPKGDVRHLRPPADAIARMGETARPALLLFPRFGHVEDVRPMGEVETFVRLTQASTNYIALGEAGFAALTGLVRSVPALAIDYADTAGAVRLVERLWAEMAR
ncbi:HprK-related kinase A [Sphingomonas profundi]|uniref:HprK-related kinase A n=1 Tax=Alterirhizorhabdus profundi TaxID=2681549 RepID=UPI0012E8E6B5|nr:HprK-related kinase A [Sphingomonas profundi]